MKFFSTFPDDHPLIKKPAQSSSRSFFLYLVPVSFNKGSAAYLGLACTNVTFVPISFSLLFFSSRVQNPSFFGGRGGNKYLIEKQLNDIRSKFTFFHLSRFVQYSALHTSLVCRIKVFLPLLVSFGPIQPRPQMSSFSLSDRI